MKLPERWNEEVAQLSKNAMTVIRKYPAWGEEQGAEQGDRKRETGKRGSEGTKG